MELKPWHCGAMAAVVFGCGAAYGHLVEVKHHDEIHKALGSSSSFILAISAMWFAVFVPVSIRRYFAGSRDQGRVPDPHGDLASVHKMLFPVICSLFVLGVSMLYPVCAAIVAPLADLPYVAETSRRVSMGVALLGTVLLVLAIFYAIRPAVDIYMNAIAEIRKAKAEQGIMSRTQRRKSTDGSDSEDRTPD